MRLIKTLFLIGTISILCLFSFVIVGADEDEEDNKGFIINNYSFEGTYHKDNTVSVKEIIDVTFSKSKHGIYRFVPLFMYANRDVGDGKIENLKYQNDVRDVSVKDWTYETDTEDNYYDIRIGDWDQYVDGKQTYEFSYTYVMPDDRVKTGDLIYYSVLGSEWKVDINKFDFTMNFDEPLSQEEMRNFELHSGPFGDEKNGLKVDYDLQANKITGSAQNIDPENAITLYCPVHEGYFQGEKTYSKIFPYALFFIACAITLIILLYELLKKQKKPVQTVEFYPPDGMSSAEVGVIIDEMVDDIDLISLIPWWGEKGYLTIEEIPDRKGRGGEHASLRLHKKNDLPMDAPTYQKTLFNGLFATNPRDLDSLSGSFSQTFSSAKSQLGSEFKGPKQLSTGKVKAGALLFLMCAAWFGAICTSSMVSYTENLIFGAISAGTLFAFGILRLITFGQDSIRTKAKWMAYILVLLALVGASVGFTLAAVMDYSVYLKFYFYIPVLVVMILVSYSVGRLVSPTKYKLEQLGKLLGLKQFIKTAEIEKLNMLIEEDPSYFFNVLPFAMVFGLSDHWSKQFKKLTIKPPDWYICYDLMYFNTFYFHSMLWTGMQQPIQHLRTEAIMKAAASAASSGFSGGGGGGGGGGSW